MSGIAQHFSLAAPGLTVRPMVAADYTFSRTLSDALARAAFVNLILPEPEFAGLLAQQFRAQQIGYRQCFPKAEYFVIAEEGKSVGRVIVAVEPMETNSGAGDKRPSSPPGGRRSYALRIVDIALSPEAQGRGIWHAVMTGLVNAARSIGVQGLTLSVSSLNDRARRLYLRLGFVDLGGDAVLQMMKLLP